MEKKHKEHFQKDGKEISEKGHLHEILHILILCFYNIIMYYRILNINF
ncbi:hypothetical protein bthur0004_65980 [Bacillus thuringiensis serovar sotto str. T04001]|nr:hypothetical protein bthur0004_65980 [Bacillus thuringiensis serovar sotto str. T04001]